MNVRFVAIVLISTAASLVAQPRASLSLKVLDGSAPPGQIVQIQIKNTEPVPIFGGRGSYESDFFSSYEGFAVYSPRGDASGTAVLQGNKVKLSALSPRGDFGTGTDYPIITIAARIAANRPVGSSTVISLDAASLLFTGFFGFRYPVEAAPGTITAANGLSISNVVPGSATLLPGAQVTVFGTGFTPDTRIRLSETIVRQTQFVSPTEMRVIVGSRVEMHGTEVRAIDRSGTVRYYSYQRTVPEAPSAHPVLARTEPIFSPGQITQAVFASLPSDANRFFGFAFQNIGAAPAVLTVQLSDVFGRPLGQSTLTVGVNRRVVKLSRELLAADAPVGTFWRITATAPVQMLQIRGEVADFSASPAPALFVR